MVKDIYLKPIHECTFSVRTCNSLMRARITTVGYLIKKSKEDLLSIRNFGKNSLKEVENFLSSIGFKLDYYLIDNVKLKENNSIIFFKDVSTLDDDTLENLYKLIPIFLINIRSVKEVLNLNINVLDIPNRAKNCLKRYGIYKLIDLVEVDINFLISIPSFGKQMLFETKSKLELIGINIGRQNYSGLKKYIQKSKEIINEYGKREKNKVQLLMFKYDNLKEFLIDSINNSNFNERDKFVIIERFINHKTLEEIGLQLNITRERVRQIVKKIQNKYLQVLTFYLRDLIDYLKNFIADNSIIIEENISTVIKNIYPQVNFTSKDIDLVVELIQNKIIPDLDIRKSNNFIYFCRKSFKRSDRLEDVIVNILKEKSDLSLIDLLHLVEKKLSIAKLKINEYFLRNYIIIFGINFNVYFIGNKVNFNILKTSKNINESIYQLLKKYNKPLHFKEINNLLKVENERLKNIYQGTIHNILISDDKYICVDRGVYALNEWDFDKYKTYTEVIIELLSASKKPLTINELATELKKINYFNKNNIIASIRQNKTIFKEIGFNLYGLYKEKSYYSESIGKKSEIELLDLSINKDKIILE